MLWLKILGGLVALAIGVWLGMPGRYEQTESEIDELLVQSGRGRRRVKRHKLFDPSAWFMRKAPPPRIGHNRFRVTSPEEQD